MWRKGRWLFSLYWKPGDRIPTLSIKDLEKVKEAIKENAG